MRKHVAAEWFLARFIKPQNAAAVIGDLQETAVQKGSMWFWQSYAGTLFSCAWRPLAAYLVVLFTGEPIGKALWQLARMLDRNGYRLGGLISVICILSSIAIYGFLRFGLKNSVARLALIYVVIGIAGVVLGLQPGPCMALWVAVTVLSFFASCFSQTRHAMASLAIVFMVVPFFLLAFFTLQMAASRFFEFSFAELSLFGRLFGPMMTLVMCLVFSRVNPSSRRMSDRVSA